MKTLALAAAILSATFALAQYPTGHTEQPPPQNQAVLPPHIEQSAPREYAIMFVPTAGEGLAFFKTPDGTSGVLPVSRVKEAFAAGYTPVTVGDIVDAADASAKTIQNLQKRLSDLASDYDALVARYNRLAAINATPAANAYVPPQETDDQATKRAMKLMLFQSLLSRTAPARPIQVQVTDCTAHPALCVH
jgi:hypothetical protein